MKKTHLNKLYLPAIAIILWWIVTDFNLISPLFLPPLDTFLSGALRSLNMDLVIDIIATLKRALLGICIAGMIAIPAGIILGSRENLYEIFELPVEFFRAIPITAIFPLFLLVLGIGDESKIAMIAFGTMLILLINTMHGVHNIRKTRLESANIMGIQGINLFQHVLLPDALPSIVTGLRLSISYALILAVVTEMFIGANSGIGFRIIMAQYVYDTVGMYVGIMAIGLIGFSLNSMILVFEKKYIHWKRA